MIITIKEMLNYLLSDSQLRYESLKIVKELYGKNQRIGKDFTSYGIINALVS